MTGYRPHVDEDGDDPGLDERWGRGIRSLGHVLKETVPRRRWRNAGMRNPDQPPLSCSWDGSYAYDFKAQKAHEAHDEWLDNLRRTIDKQGDLIDDQAAEIDMLRADRTIQGRQIEVLQAELARIHKYLTTEATLAGPRFEVA